MADMNSFKQEITKPMGMKIFDYMGLGSDSVTLKSSCPDNIKQFVVAAAKAHKVKVVNSHFQNGRRIAEEAIQGKMQNAFSTGAGHGSEQAYTVTYTDESNYKGAGEKITKRLLAGDLKQLKLQKGIKIIKEEKS